MERYNFDEQIPRKGSGALKIDALQRFYGRDDLLPMWVADMDFRTPDFITDALRERLEHPIFGYTVEPEQYRPTVAGWIYDHHGWQIEHHWLCYIPGIVKGIGMAINVFVAPDEKVIIQPPIYHPFRNTPLANGRQVVYNPLRENEDGSYSMDFENLAAVADDKCRMLILANPHNPIGIVWDRDTLTRLADFCAERNIIVISDEIHCDMALYGHKHIPFASVSERAAECSITFGAPSKTFNIAGIVSSYAIVPNDTLREKFYGWLEANELGAPHLFAPIATIAAFKYGEPWRKQMLEYVEGNVEFLVDYCAKYIPQIRPIRPQASFLVWLDCRALNLPHRELVALFEERAHLALNEGSMFGTQGEGFMRLNVGTTRATLESALESLRRVLA
ncbi:MAG: PatB family C-S lyase [Alistipes sp.]|nr:PatB family C-S lyase [Alistipes sp.]